MNQPLDPEMIGGVLDVMRELAHENFTIVCVTHENGLCQRSLRSYCFYG